MSSGDKARLAILASGGGSNADTICTYFARHPHIEVSVVITNRLQAGVREVAKKHQVECVYIPKAEWPDQEKVSPILQHRGITHIVLAGFLLLIPEYLIAAYAGKIINIHPSLLPRHGGKGMFGMHVHEAVKASGERISGMTIHEVDPHFDEGRILFQKEVILDASDSPSDIARKVLRLEHEYYPKVIEQWIESAR